MPTTIFSTKIIHTLNSQISLCPCVCVRVCICTEKSTNTIYRFVSRLIQLLFVATWCRIHFVGKRQGTIIHMYTAQWSTTKDRDKGISSDRNRISIIDSVWLLLLLFGFNEYECFVFYCWCWCCVCMCYRHDHISAHVRFCKQCGRQQMTKTNRYVWWSCRIAYHLLHSLHWYRLSCSEKKGETEEKKSNEPPKIRNLWCVLFVRLFMCCTQQ